MNIFRKVFGPPLSVNSVEDVDYAAKRWFSGSHEVLTISAKCIKVTSYNVSLMGGLETATYEAYDDGAGRIRFRQA